MPSKKEIWAQWDDAWAFPLDIEARHLRLLACTSSTSNFTYTNQTAAFTGSDLDALVSLIDGILHPQWDTLKIRHVQWFEHHDESAVRWEVVNKQSEKVISTGWSHATYGSDGKLVSVSDFYEA